MNEMIERVARAIHVQERERCDAVWEDLPVAARQAMFRKALAAIAAMREPTLAMAEAPYKRIDEIPKTDPPCYPLAYQKMIDAALKD